MSGSRALLALMAVVVGAGLTAGASAQKTGGTLRIYHRDSPASMSIHEEGTIGVIMPMMGVFNNLVVFDQHVAQNSLQSIVPELATSWSWSEDGKDLSFRLRSDVKWHDGEKFTAQDVKCTFDLLTGQGQEKLRLNYRGSWWVNVEGVTTNGDAAATLHLKRPQPSILPMLAAGYTPIYPCHVPPREMRRHPIGTGPFKFVEYKPNDDIRVARNPDYWKAGRPYLDAIEYSIIPNRSTAILAFIAGKFDMTFPWEVTIPLLRDIKAQSPQALCQVGPAGESVGVLINRKVAPFDSPDLRRAVALAIDRKAFIDILGQGQGDLGGALLPAPEGVWGMPAEMLQTLPGYGGDVQKNRETAKAIMEKLGYGPQKRLPVKISVRNLAVYRDPGALLIDQLKLIGIDGELETVETANWVPKLIRKDFVVGVNVLGTAVDDPDVVFYQNYVCDTVRNYTGFCNREWDKAVERQSIEPDPDKRKQMVWKIDYQLQQEEARPIIYYVRAATCWQPRLKGLTLMTNSQYNGWRFEDVWLDQ